MAKNTLWKVENSPSANHATVLRNPRNKEKAIMFWLIGQAPKLTIEHFLRKLLFFVLFQTTINLHNQRARNIFLNKYPIFYYKIVKKLVLLLVIK